MTLNFPGPYELRLFYSVDKAFGDVIQHQARFSCILDSEPDVGADFDDIDVVTRSSGILTLTVVLAALVAVFEGFVTAAEGTVDLAELWKYTEGTFEATYVATEDISSAGADLGSAVAASESIWTMRTLGGGIMKVVVLDGPGTSNVPKTYAGSTQDNKDLWDFFTHATDAPFVARDGTYPAVPLRVFVGTNEHLFKRRYGR